MCNLVTFYTGLSMNMLPCLHTCHKENIFKLFKLKKRKQKYKLNCKKTFLTFQDCVKFYAYSMFAPSPPIPSTPFTNPKRHMMVTFQLPRSTHFGISAFQSFRRPCFCFFIFQILCLQFCCHLTWPFRGWNAICTSLSGHNLFLFVRVQFHSSLPFKASRRQRISVFTFG